MAETKSLLKTRTCKTGTVGSNPTHSAIYLLLKFKKFTHCYQREFLNQNFCIHKIIGVTQFELFNISCFYKTPTVVSKTVIFLEFRPGVTVIIKTWALFLRLYK